MYEDQPQELVHDLISEATFGSHPLGRPVIGTAEVISSVSRRTVSELPPLDVRARATSSWRRPGNLKHEEFERLPLRGAAQGGRRRPQRPDACVRRSSRRRRRASASSARTPSSTTSALGAPGIAALRPAPLRRVDPRRDPRRLGLVAALPGDPREARDGLRRLQLRRPQYTDTGQVGDLRRHARGQPRRLRSRSSREQIARRSRRRTFGPSELERAKENLKGRIMLSMESDVERA